MNKRRALLLSAAVPPLRKPIIIPAKTMSLLDKIHTSDKDVVAVRLIDNTDNLPGQRDDIPLIVEHDLPLGFPVLIGEELRTVVQHYPVRGVSCR